MYVDFTIRHYGKATVVFDGYSGGPSIKDNTHQRRGKVNTHPIVNFNADTEFSGKREDFLARDSNKQGLIDLISDGLRQKDCTVINAVNDADVDIAKAAVDSSCHHSTTLIGEDTDLLILLLHYASTCMQELYFRSDNSTSKTRKIYDIRRIRLALGQDLCSKLLFLHGFTGCDTTSRIFGIGKRPIFNKLVKGEPTIRSCADAFTLPNQTTDGIKNLGAQAMAVVCGGKCTDSLASLRFKVFNQKVASAKSFVSPERLPPTASATEFHSLRTYYQIMVWTGAEANMEASDWGWKRENNLFVPIMSVGSAAPYYLLKMIHCACSSNCRSNRCSCRGYGLPCHVVCGPCQAGSCENPFNHVTDDSDQEEQE